MMNESLELTPLEAELICFDLMEQQPTNQRNLHILDLPLAEMSDESFLNIFPIIELPNATPGNRVDNTPSGVIDLCSPERNHKRPSNRNSKNPTTKRKQDDNPIEVKCRICYESLLDRIAMTTECGHMFCKTCLDQVQIVKKVCPMCNSVINRVFRVYL